MTRLKIIENYLPQVSRDIISFATKHPLRTNIDLSVVIPAYNEEKTLPKLLVALNNQSNFNFEVIVVDNGSLDRTSKTVLTYANKAKYPVFLINEVKPGPGNARKAGMDFALFRAIKRDPLGKRKHILVITDADTCPPEYWLKQISEKFQEVGTGALAGTHGASERLDIKIENKLGIKHYFNIVPEIVEYFLKNNIGQLKMSGPNAAFEIEAYAAGGGMRQPFNEALGRIELKEVPQLADRIRQAGYPVLPMDVRIIASRRRHLTEIISQQEMYFPSNHLSKDRFLSVRDDELDLIEHALSLVPKEKWEVYRNKMLSKVIQNVLLKPLFSGRIQTVDLLKQLPFITWNNLQKNQAAEIDRLSDAISTQFLKSNILIYKQN